MSRKSLPIYDHKPSNNAYILMALFYCAFFLIADFSLNVTIMVILLTGLEVGIAFYSLHGSKMSIKYTIIPYFIIGVIIFINLRNNGYIGEQPFYLFSLIMFLFIIPFCKPSNTDRDRVIKIFTITATIVASLVYISRLFPFLFEQIYLKRISLSSNEYNHWIMSQGYSGVVGGDIGRTALYIATGLSFSSSKYIIKKNPRDLFLIVYLLGALFFVGRRSELILFFLASLIIYYGMSSTRKKQKIILLLIVLFCFLIVIYYLIANNIITYSGNNRIIRSVFLFVHGADVSNGRIRLYTAAWESIKKNPIFGIGWGGARKITRAILSNDVNVHNIYIQALCEIGIAGSFPLAILIFIIGKMRYKNFKYYLGSPKAVYVTSALLLFFYIFLYGLFDNPVYHDDYWLLVSILYFMTNNLGEKKELII